MSRKGASESEGPHFSPQTFDSFDARIVQYNYALAKLKMLIQSIDRLLEQVSVQDDKSQRIVLVQYIVYLTGLVFAINESGFSPKLQSLENFKPIKPGSIAISQVVTHVPYDFKDYPVQPLEDLPTAKQAIECLRNLRVLCAKCSEGYKKRMENASRELQNDVFLDEIEHMISSEWLSPDLDVNLSLISDGSTLPAFTISSPASDGHPDANEASLIDMDLCALFSITKQTSQVLNRNKDVMSKYKELKQSSTANLADFPLGEYALHRVLFCALRFNELYYIIRRFGRQIYLSNQEHLHDPKFLLLMSNGAYFRTQILRNIAELFDSTKKNGVLVATITRFIRIGTPVPISAKTIIEFSGFIQQSYTYIESLRKSLHELGRLWLAAEVAFRKLHDLPVEYLEQLNNAIQVEHVKQLQAKKVQEAAQLARAKERAKAAMTPVKAAAATRSNVPIKLSQTPNRSRSSSVNSNDIPALTSKLAAMTPKSPPQRQGSLYQHSNNSANSMQTTPTAPVDKTPVSTTSTGRRRSNSQPLSFNAAAAALKSLQPADKKSLRSPTGSIRTSAGNLRSPTGSIRSANGAVKQPVPKPVPQSSPTPIRTVKLPYVDPPVPEEQPEKAKPLTANQKFQLHLKNASKSGALFTQQKEVFENVVFDPNNPSATQIRRNPQEAVAVAVPEPPEPVAKPKRRVADITRANTQRNSAIPDVEDVPRKASVDSPPSEIADSDSRTSSSILGEEASIKKVRFTGVAKYSPAEDAPTSQSSRILKNFATFKMPLIHRPTAFKKKDQQLKKEESLLFKKHIEEI